MNKKQEKNIEERSIFIEKKERALKKRFSDTEKILNDKVLTEIIINLQTNDAGVILNSTVNFILLERLSEIYKDISQKEITEVVLFLQNSLNRVNKLNEIYFEAVVSKNAVKRSSKLVKRQLDGFLGVTKSGKLKKGGFLSSMVEDRSIANRLYSELFDAAISGRTLVDTQINIKNLIKGDRTAGLLEQTMRVSTNDLFSNIDRTSSVLHAANLKMSAFIYTGNRVSDSRPFCVGGRDEHAGSFTRKYGEVFISSEIESWNKIRKFEGRGKRYNAKTDLGGHNCRHHYGFIDDFTAMHLRKDLEIIDGKLTTKTPRFKKW